MKRWLSLTLAILCAALLWVGIRHSIQRQAQKKREAVYQEILHVYQQVLKTGMTRKQVESYLRAQNRTFSQMCCIDIKAPTKKHSLDDEVKIGEEDHPWFCSEHNVYLGFEFIDNAKPRERFWDADDTDMLESITILHRLEGCL